VGTSTGYSLPTSGNWPDVKRQVTSIGRSGVAEADTIGNLMGDYVQAQGGATQAAQQMSVATQAGAKLAGFLVGVQQSGLSQTLVDVGLAELVGQSAPNVLRGLTDYLVGPGSLLEEDIARWAIFEYLDEIFGHSDYEELNTVLTSLLQRESIGAILRHIFGLCIYRRFRTHFSERLMKAANGMRAVRRLFRDIKDFILGKLNVVTHGRDPMEIDWRDTEGEKLSQDVLASTWRVFGED